MKRFVSADREQGMLMPYDVRLWLPEDHLARFVVDIVEDLDFKHIYNQYKGVGSTPYDPKLLMSLLFYGYATGVFSSRKIEQGTYDSVAFRFIAGNHHPDHDTISSFRKRFLPEIKGMFKEILLIGKELKLVKMGNIYIDGTKVQANASRHKAMSYEYMKKLEQQLESEIETLLDLANKQDEKEASIDADIPEEIRMRKDRLEKIKEAKKIVENRAAERYKKEKEDYDQKMQKRNEKQDKTGKNPRGRAPKPPVESPEEKDQCNFTDSESRIMKTSRGFDQCYNGQAAVNEDMLIVGAYCNAHINDKQEFIPAIEAVPNELGKIENAIADTGYFSEKNISDCEQKGISALISTARDKHNSFLDKLLNADKETSPAETPIEKMQQKLRKHGDIYKKRKQTVEPVFGIIKEILGFRRFSLRGEVQVDGEWSLVCSAYNLKRMFNLSLG
jgi:transposase